MFPKWVSYETGIRVGFNGGNDTYQFIIEQRGRRFNVYHTKYPREPQPNIIVVDAIDTPDELYLRTYPGKDSCDCNTTEEQTKFQKELHRAIDPRFRVPGRILASKLIRIVNQINASKFKFSP
jgi:hypothetical protein